MDPDGLHFLLFCVLGNFELDASHGEYYLVEWWILFYFCTFEVCSEMW
jgi:hypothetical protein